MKFNANTRENNVNDGALYGGRREEEKRRKAKEIMRNVGGPLESIQNRYDYIVTSLPLSPHTDAHTRTESLLACSKSIIPLSSCIAARGWYR